jgi:hypothetical protein
VELAPGVSVTLCTPRSHVDPILLVKVKTGTFLFLLSAFLSFSISSCFQFETNPRPETDPRAFFISAPNPVAGTAQRQRNISHFSLAQVNKNIALRTLAVLLVAAQF